MTVIEIEGMSKSYRGRQVLESVSLKVERGEIFGIAGPNGAGKTTTVECMAGLRQRDGGVLRILGLDPQTDRRELLPRLGVQLQEASLPDAIKVGEALKMYASFYEKPADWRVVMDQWGLTERQRSRFGNLSGGWKQRLFIALALVGNPEVVFLDELTTGLDPSARRMTWGLIREIRDRGATVVLVTHFMDEAKALCDRMAIIDHGRVIIQGTPDELIVQGRTENLEDAYFALTGGLAA
ncbi:ABC transporter ATP-binding protein [Nonomuraea sp. NPDC049480]|uniref:ABC transporter ATP-binding protein n=1 Tax=Nonomuraea sp. NPDC049480 TaxID=3364353 RepID=UPI00379A9012